MNCRRSLSSLKLAKEMKILSMFHKEKNSLDNLKDKLSKGNNLLEYFLILGLNPNICTQNFLYDTNIEELNSIFNLQLKPNILSKYPPYEKSHVNIDKGIIYHCFPNKFEVKMSPKEPPIEIFSFILDNYYFSINYPQKYISCLVFYENLQKYKTMQEIINNNKKKNNEYSSSTLCGSYQSKNSLYEQSELSSKTRSPNSHRSQSQEIENKYNNSKYLSYYIPKCILLISIYPVFKLQEEILHSIYIYSLRKNNTIPIEKIILNFLVEVPMPPKGLSTIEFSLFNVQKIIKSQKMNEIPNAEEEIFSLINIMGVKDTIEIYKHLLYETKMIFFSSNKTLLTSIIGGILNALIPFKYPFQVLSYVPKKNLNVIESITPYILGINYEYTNSFFHNANIDLNEVSILIIDLENKKLHLNSEEKFPDLPEYYKKKLFKFLTRNYEYRINNKKFQLNEDIEFDDFNDKDTYKVKDKEKNKKLKEFKEYGNKRKYSLQFPFLQFNVNIMKNYSKYLNDDYYKIHGQSKISNFRKLFNVDAFISNSPSSFRPFYNKFIKETQMFNDFIYKRMIPNNMNDKLDIMLFDEYIFLKKNRKHFTSKSKSNIIFISSREYDFKENYKVPKPIKLNEEETKKFNSSIYRNNLLSLGQDISQIEGNIIFSYPLFPKLNNDIFYFNLDNYVYPPLFNDEIRKINSSILAQSHLNSITVSQAEMENYIYLTWLKLWASTFWYHDNTERLYRFKQMMEVIDKVNHHEMEILNLIFETLSKSSEDEMILSLYAKLISCQINPTMFIYSIMKKIFEKKGIKFEQNAQVMNYLKNLYILKNCDDIVKFKRRTVKTIEEMNNMTIFGEKVKFNTKYKCVECKEKNTIDLEKISKDFCGMQKEYLWVYCNNCKKHILPKLQIQIGTEINKKKLMKSNSLISLTHDLHSPYYLKEEIGVIILNSKYLEVDLFRENYGSLFWSALWYFKLNKLDFSMILPYYDSIKNRKIAPQCAQKVQIVTTIDSCELSLKNSINSYNNSGITYNYPNEDLPDLSNKDLINSKTIRTKCSAQKITFSPFKKQKTFEIGRNSMYDLDMSFIDPSKFKENSYLIRDSVSSE